MRASALLESNPAAAAQAASAVLESHPDDEMARLLLATACQRLGDPATARAQLESLVSAQPNSPILHLELGRAYAAGGEHERATAALESAVRLDARLAGAWRELAAQRFASGDTQGGDSAYSEYAKLSSLPPELNDAGEAISNRRFDVGEALLLKHLKSAPEDVHALRMLASIASKRGDYFEAERLLKKCLELAPGYADARFDLASELYAQQRHLEVMPLLERLLATDPDNSSYMGLRAQTLRLYGRNAEALKQIQQAIAASPGNAKLQLLHGHLLREVGEQDKSIGAYRQALKLQPGMGEAYWSLANLKTVRFTADDLNDMRQHRGDAARLGSNRAHLEFALGKALEDAGEFEQSFAHYAYGNALHRTMVFHDAAVVHDLVQRCKALYLPRFFAARSGWGSERIEPIFIVGMPRSGSTLLEQILASHSQVEGTRELPEIPAIVRELMLKPGVEAGAIYPDLTAQLGASDFEELSARYLARTEAHRPLAKPRFVDKLLANFMHLGLIHLMFPRATIIDARRHPLGCCFSCFKQFFARSLYFAYDQEELAQYYKDYVELMEHFDKVLPGRVHRVYYEQLVADPEGVVRRMLEHCNLPFEKGTLRFYENRRIVSTVSSEQVRRPINADAVEHWRHFEPWLGTLREQLKDLIEAYPNFDRKTNGAS